MGGRIGGRIGRAMDSADVFPYRKVLYSLLLKEKTRTSQSYIWKGGVFFFQ